MTPAATQSTVSIRRIGALDPQAIRRAALRAYPRHGGNGHGTPQDVVLQMWRDYSRTHSLATVGRLHGGRTKQAIAAIFHNRGLLLLKRGGDNRSPSARAKRTLT